MYGLVEHEIYPHNRTHENDKELASGRFIPGDCGSESKTRR